MYDTPTEIVKWQQKLEENPGLINEEIALIQGLFWIFFSTLPIHEVWESDE